MRKALPAPAVWGCKVCRGGASLYCPKAQKGRPTFLKVQQQLPQRPKQLHGGSKSSVEEAANEEACSAEEAEEDGDEEQRSATTEHARRRSLQAPGLSPDFRLLEMPMFRGHLQREPLISRTTAEVEEEEREEELRRSWGGGRGRGRGRGGRGAYNNNNPWNRQIQLQQQQRQQQQKKAKTAGNNFDFLPAEEFGEEPRDDEEDGDDGDEDDEERDVLLPADQRNHYLAAKRHKFSDAFADNAAFHREWTAFVALYPAALEDIREEMKSEQRRRRRDPLGPRPPSSEAAMEARFAAIYESLLFSEFDEGGVGGGGENGVEDPRRTLFVGVHIYVNGWTHPTASQLATLMQLTGGSFAWNFLPGRTTHTIATVLSQAQKRQERARLTTVHPEWILDCLEQRRLLPVHEYKVLKPKNDIGKMFAAIARRNAEKAAAEAEAAAAEAEEMRRMASAAAAADKTVVIRPSHRRAPPSPELINWSEFEMEEEEEEEKIRKNVQGPVVEDVRKAPQTKSKSKQTTSCSSSKSKGKKRGTQQVPTSSSPAIIELIDLGTPPEQPPSRAADKQKEQQLPTTPVKRASRRRKKPIVHPSPELTFVLNDMAAMDAEEEEEEKRRRKMEIREPPLLEHLKIITIKAWISPGLTGRESLQLHRRRPKARQNRLSTSTSTSTSAISKTSTSGPNLLGALDPSRETKSKEKTTTAKSIFTALPPSTNRPPNEKPRVKPTFRRAGERRKFDAASLAGKVIKPKIPLDVQVRVLSKSARGRSAHGEHLHRRSTAASGNYFYGGPRVVPPPPPPPPPPVPALPQQPPPPPQRPLYEQPKRLPPSELRFREFKRKLERGDERHFVPADDYMPASMSAVDAEVLAALPEDMQREMRAFVRQKAAAKEPPPAPKPTTTAGRGRGRGQVTLSGWVVRAPPPAPPPAAHPPRVQLKRKAITSSNWPELDPDLRLGSSLKLRRSGGSNGGCRDSVESPRRCWNEEEVLEIVLSGEEDEDNDLQLLLMSRSGEGPSTSISAAADDESGCLKRKQQQKESENNRSIPTTTIDPSHPKAPKKQPVKSQAKVDQMLQAFQEKRKKFTSERKTAAEKALALLSGHLDRRLGPNLVGRRRLPAVCALLRQWITSSSKEEGLLDDDLAYLLRYFSALIDAGRQDDLLVVLHRCKDYLGERERRMASESGGGAEDHLNSWRTAFYETFPAFLRQEPDFRELIPEELFWYAKKSDEGEEEKKMVNGGGNSQEVYDALTEDEE
ncbi:deoxycytidyl transferase [Tyrophagus putrescentiae]|nr:deoxycytidyl transferase [Tyrophagus putrescentiae]